MIAVIICLAALAVIAILFCVLIASKATQQITQSNDLLLEVKCTLIEASRDLNTSPSNTIFVIQKLNQTTKKINNHLTLKP